MQEILDLVTEAWQEIARSFIDPARVHATLSHFPIAFAVIGLLLVLALICVAGRSHAIRWTCFLCYVLGATVGWCTLRFGHATHKRIQEANVPLDEAAAQLLQTHRQLGQWAWLTLAIAAVIVALSAIRATAVRTVMLALALLVSLVSACWIFLTVYQGDSLVYVHGPLGGKTATVLRIPDRLAPTKSGSDSPISETPSTEAKSDEPPPPSESSLPAITDPSVRESPSPSDSEG